MESNSISPIDIEVCYFPVPGVLNPHACADKEIIETREIPFYDVLYPFQRAKDNVKRCPNGHKCRLYTISTHTAIFLVLNQDRRALSRKINRKIVEFFPDEVYLKKTPEHNLARHYHDISISEELYRVCSIVIHTGCKNRGHYYAYRRTQRGRVQWYLCNDEKEISGDKVKLKNARGYKLQEELSNFQSQ